MSNTKLLSTSKLIESVSLRCSLPITQSTFQEKDFLYFINEEMDLGVVPHILTYHEDYFLYTEEIIIESGVNRYSIPSRAIGNKLRDITYADGGSFFELTRISVEDQVEFGLGFVQNSSRSNLRAFYIEGDEIVISTSMSTGSLLLSYYIRPNSLVSENDVSVVTSISKNNGLVYIDKLPDKFIDNSIFDITSSKSSFRLVAKEVSPSGLATSNSLVYTFGTIKKNKYTLPLFSDILSASYIQVIDNSKGLQQKNIYWFDHTGSTIAPVIPNANLYQVNISTATNNSTVINLLKSIFNSSFSDGRLVLNQVDADNFTIENGGIGISVGDNFSVTASFTMIESNLLVGIVNIPKKLNVDDIISLPEETTIPQIPIELHSMLAQRVAMRCLESLGDTAGLQAAAAKLNDMEIKTGALIDNRVESSPIKIVPRHTPIKRSTYNSSRRR